MKIMKHLAISVLSLVLLGISACKKEMPPPDINRFKSSLAQQDVKTLKNELSKFNVTYSKDGIKIFLANISKAYGVTSEQLCYSCIYTLPAQSEVKFSWMENGILIEKIVDLSYDSNNKIIVVGIHD